MEVTREEIIEALAEHFGIDRDEDGNFDLEGYDWQSGCYCNGRWLCLSSVVECIEQLIG